MEHSSTVERLLIVVPFATFSNIQQCFPLLYGYGWDCGHLLKYFNVEKWVDCVDSTASGNAKYSSLYSVLFDGNNSFVFCITSLLTLSWPSCTYKFGTYNVRAKEKKEANELIKDAKKLEEIGCFAIVLEKIPATLASEISKSIKIPVIGIGAGKNVDGQVLVLHDFLGMTQKFNPRFLRSYLNLSEKIDHAVQEYTKDVKNSSFPNSDEQY